MTVRGLAAALVALALGICGSPAEAGEKDLLIFMAGQSDIDDYDEETFEGRIEFTSHYTDFGAPPYFGGFGPLLGFMASGKGSVFGYGGVYGDFFLGDHIVIRPEGGGGGFVPGNAKDLGGLFQFHAAITFAYVFDNEARVGITLTHISNFSIHGSNPGLDSGLISYAMPVGPWF